MSGSDVRQGRLSDPDTSSSRSSHDVVAIPLVRQLDRRVNGSTADGDAGEYDAANALSARHLHASPPAIADLANTQVRQLSARVRSLETLLAVERRRAEQVSKAAAKDLFDMRARVRELEENLTNVRRESNDRAGAIEHLEGSLRHALHVAHDRAILIESLQGRINSLLLSTSWKLSAPVRMLGVIKGRKP